jgi:hypothetical protein
MTPQTQQVDAIAVIDALTAEIAALTRRAVIAEQRAAALEAEINKESK